MIFPIKGHFVSLGHTGPPERGHGGRGSLPRSPVGCFLRAGWEDGVPGTMGWDWAARAGPSGQGQVLGGGGDGATEGAHPAPCSPRRGFTTAPPPCPGSNFGQACPVCQQLPSALRHESHWWQRERIHSSRAEPGRACVLGLSARRVVSGLPGARPSGHGMFLSPGSSPSAQTSQPPGPRTVLCVHACECVCMRVSVCACE